MIKRISSYELSWVFWHMPQGYSTNYFKENYWKPLFIFFHKPVTGIGPVFERWQRPALTTILHRQKLGYYAQLT